MTFIALLNKRRVNKEMGGEEDRQVKRAIGAQQTV